MTGAEFIGILVAALGGVLLALGATLSLAWHRHAIA